MNRRFLRQAQDRLFDCASRDETARGFAQDDTSFGERLIRSAFIRCALDEEGVERGIDGYGLGGASEFSGGGVAAEDGDAGGVLVAAEEPLGGGV